MDVNPRASNNIASSSSRTSSMSRSPLRSFGGILSVSEGGWRTWPAPLSKTARRCVCRLDLRWIGGLVSREVEVTLGPMRERGEARVVPIEWGASGFAGMFPVLNGDLELAAIGSRDCRLSLDASYHPPLGDLGRALDRALLHRVAQSTVRSFLARVATALETDNGNRHTPGSSDLTGDRSRTEG